MYKSLIELMPHVDIPVHIDPLDPARAGSWKLSLKTNQSANPADIDPLKKGETE